MNSTSPTQLILGIKLNDEARFDNFFVADANRQLLDLLASEVAADQILYIRAMQGAGLTHLLQAVCHARSAIGESAIYLPLKDRLEFSPDILEGIEALNLVCIDNVEVIAGDSQWELALFNAFNRAALSGTQLVFGANCALSDIGLKLADLHSRLQLAPVYQLQSLADDDKKAALQMRAASRGMNLNSKVAEYILARKERSMSSLMAVLEALDTSTLSQRRALTVPLVKDTMGW
ncbi:MAG: DnaA regulatory inactivator Hda [Gammaproteobacteria bacterium]